MVWWKTQMSIHNGQCFELEPVGNEVRIRNSRFPDRVAVVSFDHWTDWRTSIQSAGKLTVSDVFRLLPHEEFGDLAETFNAVELDALLDGITRDELQLVWLAPSPV